MRKRLFLLCLTLCLCSSAFALDSGNYLVRNVATGRYWGAANSWGTQASLVSNPEYITWTKLDDGRYHLESQVNNGGEAYYFNGDFMDNDSPIALTIEQQANGYYTISNGEIYYGYNGSNTVLGKTETDPAAPNVQWEIISVADATAALSGATQTAPMNATFLVADPNFGRNNRHYGEWTFEASNKNNEGDVTNYCVESWHATFTMSQTINVPNGVYSLSAQGFYRQDGTDNEHLPVFFLNDATRTFPIRTGTENSMALTSASFSEGRYAIDPIYVTVTDGTITLGARLEGNTMLWCIWDNFTLMYYGTDANQKQMEFGTRFGGKANKVNQLLATPSITTEGLQRLNDAKTALAQIDYNASESSQQTVEQQIDAAIAYAEEGLQLAERLNTYYNKYGDKLGSAATNNQELSATLANISVALMQQTFESNSQIEQWIEALITARSQYYPYEYRYWFDNDESTVQTDVSSLPTWSFDADVSQLPELMHTLHFQVFGKDGVPSTPLTRFFVKGFDRNATTGFCWFDNDETTKTAIADLSQPIELDVNQLVDGLHILHIQANGTDGTVSTPITRAFIKTPQVKGVDYLTCLCIVDDQLYKQEQVSANGGVLQWQLDVSQLSQGFHRMFVQVVTPSGAATSAYQSFFMRETTAAEYAQMKCVYAIDGAEFFVEAGEVAKGTFHFDLDVSALDDGLHRITYMLSNGQGVSTKAQTQFFMKTPLGGNGITAYWYWLNDQADSNATKVQLTERQDPFSLISLLPVESQPLRSSLFEFRIEDEKPVLYAKNDFHVRFYDSSGRFTDATKQFVDESVRQEVTDVEWIESGVRATTAKPAGNSIKWYCLDAEPGDSLQFKLDRAATIQLFAPSGEEVFNTFGSESVKWGGCHVKEKGIYYLALHDVTAQQGTTVSVDFNQIGKYAILAFTPDRFSSDGTTIMYIEGNGLTFVKSLELVNGDEVLHPDTIVANTTNLLARFVLNSGNDTPQTYTLNVVFNNEEENDSRTITRRNAITIEPLHKGEICISVETERRVGDPYPIKVTMKNTGNVGYYGIPVDIAFDHPERIDEFRFVNFDLLLSDSIYNSRGFFTYTDNLVGTGQKGFFMPILVPYLAPYEEKTFVFGVKTKIAHAKFNFYAWAGTPMYDGNIEEVSSAKRKAPPCNPTNIPDVYEALGDADNLTNLPISPSRVLRPFIGAAEAIAGMIQGSTRAREDAVFDAYGIDPSIRDNYRFQYRNCVRSPYDIARDAHPLQSPRRAAGTGGGSAIDSNASSDCPNPDPHDTDVYIPGDPNEITGYLAESGSHYMTDEIKTVGYDIEFENDPELANSSAHSIIIENQLDPSVFDLSSFTPKDITISNKKVELNGEQSFVTTLDLRTTINVIAELRCDYDSATGNIKWTMTSLDPMSMEPTDDIMQGILPINNGSGDGIGHVTYTVDLLDGLEHGTTIANKASIVFDNNDAIETPYWTNVVDRIAPVSTIDYVLEKNDSTVEVALAAVDDLSGVWRYDVYIQQGTGSAWWKAAENVPADSVARVRAYKTINNGYCVVATDSAGNREVKTLHNEMSAVVTGDTNGDGAIDFGDVVMLLNHIAGRKPEGMVVPAADLNDDETIDFGDVVALLNLIARAK